MIILRIFLYLLVAKISKQIFELDEKGKSQLMIVTFITE